MALKNERSYPKDPAYGFRQLVDIAERGVSNPFNDPTTTVQAIDRLHDALRQLATRTIPTGELYDELGTLRLIEPTLTYRAPGPAARPVPRADVAAAMLSLAVGGDMVHRSPFIVSG